MAVKIGFNSATTFGQSGSFYSSEILLAIAAGPYYISQNTATLLPLPAWLYLTLPAGQATDLQYSPDSQVTWYSARQGTGNLIFADTAGSWRLFNNAVGSVDVRVFAIKQ